MQITGIGYFAFVVIALFGHHLLKASTQWQKHWLTACSFYFYMTLDWRFAGLLVALSACNHIGGAAIASSSNPSRRKTGLIASVSASLLILFYFKYFNFFAESINGFLTLISLAPAVPLLDILLPVGISFLVFQAITYPLDLYLGRLKQTYSFPDFLLFLSFFPRLLSGPIVRASYFSPQLVQAPFANDPRARIEGIVLVMRGLIKKVLLADTLGVALVDPMFANPQGFAWGFVALGVLAYSLQVYMDLSGYTDMALGVGRMFGYRLPDNFNRPYLATSIANFWQRWHITMSSFFRDYLYHGLSRAWPERTYANLLLVFVLIGLWHGAGWNFVIYGAIHGSLVGWEHWRSSRRKALGLPAVVYRGWQLVGQIAFIFLLVALTRVLFRCDTAGDALLIYGSLLGTGEGEAFPVSALALAALAATILLHLSPIGWRDRIMGVASALPWWVIAPGFVGLSYALLALGPGGGGFIYFNF